jgi:hypothetical protein
MAFRDKNNVELFIDDIIEKDDQKYIIRLIESYSFVTVAVVENIINHKIETFELRDIIKCL